MKILVLRFSSIGDIVLTTPVVRCLHQQLNATVHFCTKKSFVAPIEHHPAVAKIFTFERDVEEVVPALRAENYDWIIDLHHNLRSARLKWALGRPNRAFPKLNIQKWLYVNLKINCLPNRHIVDRYLDAVRHLGVQYDGQGLDYYIPETVTTDITQIAPQLQPNAYQAVVLGATHATKRLPLPKAIALCQQLSGPIALLGGPAEAEEGTTIAQHIGTRAVNFAGKCSLHESARILQHAQRVLTHDTGLMHIAAALRKPIVSIWGSTVPAFGMYPFFPDECSGEEARLEVNTLSCRPCSKIGYTTCPKGHFRCMQDQDFTNLPA